MGVGLGTAAKARRKRNTHRTPKGTAPPPDPTVNRATGTPPAQRVCARASDSSGPSESREAARREIARIERAIFEGDDRTLDEYGDLQAGLERIVELKEFQRTLRSRAAIDCFATDATSLK